MRYASVWQMYMREVSVGVVACECVIRVELCRTADGEVDEIASIEIQICEQIFQITCLLWFEVNISTTANSRQLQQDCCRQK